MKAPNLTRELVLETPERVPDGAGGFAEGWSALGTLWAEVKMGAGRERAGAAATSLTTYRITVRGAPVGSTMRPLAEQRFREGTRLFRILAVGEADASARHLLCICQEEVSA